MIVDKVFLWDICKPAAWNSVFLLRFASIAFTKFLDNTDYSFKVFVKYTIAR